MTDKAPKAIHEVLGKLQAAAYIPKAESGNQGRYQYRTIDAIISVVKPVLKEENAVIILNDEITEVSGRFYIKATATLKVGDEEESANGWAREEEKSNIMSEAQTTGACSTYARKSALGALLLIEDNDDPDDPHMNQPQAKPKPKPTPRPQQSSVPTQTTGEPPATTGTVATCSDCNEQISEKVLEFSTKRYGRALCFDCQKKQS